MAKATAAKKLAVVTDVNALTWDQVASACETYYPGIGRQVVDQIREWNSTLFDDALPPAPIVLARSSSVHKHWAPALPADAQSRMYEPAIIDTRQHGNVRPLVGVSRANLLRGMVQRHLQMQGKNCAYGGVSWCQAIMEVHRLLTGKRIWASPQTRRVIEEIVGDSNMPRRRAIVEQAEGPKGEKSLPIGAIQAWPIGLIDLCDITPSVT